MCVSAALNYLFYTIEELPLIEPWTAGDTKPYLFPIRLTIPMIVDTRLFLSSLMLFRPEYFCFSLIPASFKATFLGKLRFPVESVR